MKRLACALLILLPVAPLTAQCRVRHQSFVVNRHHVVEAALATYYQAPAYGPAWAGGYGDDVGQELRQIRQLLEQLLKAGGPAAASQQNLHPGELALVNTCAACHSVGAEAKGGGFAFIRGGKLLDSLTLLEVAKMTTNIAVGHMPKGAIMEPKGKADALAYLKQIVDAVKLPPGKDGG